VDKCRQHIEEVYKSKRFIETIKKIDPVELQDDLMQEVAIALLNMDCELIERMHQEQRLLNYSIGIIWMMGTKQKGLFYKLYKKKDHEKAYQWMIAQQGNDVQFEFVKVAKNILNKKLSIDPNQAHESIIFTKYVELRSCQKVADYFGIPQLHVFQVVKKMKIELKKAIRK
jgi:tRNA isopentenyl-2-thiomethyl-A-37 hydroxylase MiaE